MAAGPLVKNAAYVALFVALVSGWLFASAEVVQTLAIENSYLQTVVLLTTFFFLIAVLRFSSGRSPS